MSRKLYKEYVYGPLLKKDLIFLSIFTILIFIINYNTGQLLENLDLIIVLILVIIFIPMGQVKILENYNKRLHNGKIEKTVITFDKNIVMDEGKQHLEIGYSQISKIVETKSLVVLMMGRFSAVIVYKDGFTKGTLEEFKQFIDKKIN